jgi:hypothetical protein
MNYHYAVKFTGVLPTPNRIKRRTHIIRSILAENSSSAITQAMALIHKNPKFKGLYYPTYSIYSVD